MVKINGKEITYVELKARRELWLIIEAEVEWLQRYPAAIARLREQFADQQIYGDIEQLVVDQTLEEINKAAKAKGGSNDE